VALGAAGRPEVQRSRQVHHQPGDQLVLGDRVPHVGGAGPGRDVPVDAAGIVARGVGPGLAELGAQAHEPPGVITVQQPVDPAAERELEAADGLGG
jgi:hypothetical protein